MERHWGGDINGKQTKDSSVAFLLEQIIVNGILNLWLYSDHNIP